MKQLTCLIIFFLFLLVTNCFAQKGKLPSRFSVVLSPAIVTLNGPRLTAQPGLQYEKGGWGIGSEAAFLLYKHGIQLADVHYLRLGAELRRYLFTKPATKDYVSLQINYTWQSFTDSSKRSYYANKGGKQFSYTSAFINAPVLVVALKVGQEYRLSNKLYIDLFGGIGARTTFTEYSNVVNRQEVIFYGLRDGITFPARAYRYNQTLTRLHLAAGFRLGYIL